MTYDIYKVVVFIAGTIVGFGIISVMLAARKGTSFILRFYTNRSDNGQEGARSNSFSRRRGFGAEGSKKIVRKRRGFGAK